MTDSDGDDMSEREPTLDELLAALEAFKQVVSELDVDWTARKPIQGEGTAKVFAYRMAKAALNADRTTDDRRFPKKFEGTT